MEKKEITYYITHATDWISNIVLVKISVKLRMCLDPQNQALKRTECPIQTTDEIIPLLTNIKFLSIVHTNIGV